MEKIMNDGYPQGVIEALNTEIPAEAALARVAHTIANGMDQFSGREAMHFENILAHAVHNAHDANPDNPTISLLAQDAWPRVSSSIGLRNKFLADRVLDDTAAYARRAAEVLSNQTAANSMDLEDAVEALREMIRELGNEYPGLNLSFGYIGNCSLGCGPAYDDRSWKVFTTLSSTAGAQACNISWGGYSSSMLGHMVLAAQRELKDWCERTSADLKAGKLYCLKEKAA